MTDLIVTIGKLRECLDPTEHFDDLPSFFARIRKLPAEIQAEIDAHQPHLHSHIAARDAGEANESLLAEIERFESLINLLTARRDYVRAVVGKIDAADERAKREADERKAAAEAAEQSRLHAIRKAAEAHAAGTRTLVAFQTVDVKAKDLAEAVRVAWATALEAGPAMDDRDFTRAVDRAFGRLPSILHHHISFLPTVSGAIPADQAVFAKYLPALPVQRGTPFD